MAQNFYSILTTIGKAKLANAYALGTKLNLKTLAAGDGSGTYYEPTENQTSLKNQVWSGNINAINVDDENPNWIVISAVIPTTVGGFTIREVGIFDDSGNMIAIGKYPETYKPVLEEGSSKDLTINMILEISNTSTVTLKVDPTVILATKKDVQNLQNQISNISIPVKSVNTKTGDIVLKAEDIKVNDGSTLEQFKSDFNSHKADYTLQVPYAGVTTGTANTYAITTPTITTLKAGMAISLKFNVDSTGASTLNWCGLGAKGIKKSNGTDVTNLKTTGIYTLRYDGTNFILQGEGGSGNATASDLLSGKTASTDAGDIIGTMPDNGAVIITPSTVNQTIANGRHNGSGYVKGDANLIAANIISGKSVFGVVGSATVATLGGKYYASGNANATTGGSDYTRGLVSVSGLAFTPKVIVIREATYGGYAIYLKALSTAYNVLTGKGYNLNDSYSMGATVNSFVTGISNGSFAIYYNVTQANGPSPLFTWEAWGD